MKDGSQLELSQPIIKLKASEIKQNKKRNDKQSAEDIVIAVNYLAKIQDSLRKKLNRPPARKEILDEMAAIGFEISIATLWRYRGKIKKVGSFVRDLLEEGTYSALQFHNSELLDYIEEESIKYLNQSWTNSKNITKDVAGDKESHTNEEHVTEELAAGKYQFLRILTKVVELRTKFTNDDNLNLSCAMLSEEFQKQKNNLEESERRLVETSKELKAVLRKNGKTETSND